MTVPSWPAAYGIIAGLLLGTALAIGVAYWARRGQPVVVLVTTWMSWLLVFVPCILVPIDLSADSAVDRTKLEQMWRFLWWTSMACGWLVIPFVQEYYNAGEFTFGGRLWRSVRSNAVFYAGLIVLALLGMLIMGLAYHWTLSQMDAVVSALSNTFGIALCMCLLGYGLVEVPRATWRMRLSAKERLRHCHREAAHFARELSSYRVTLALIYRVLERLSALVVTTVDHPLYQNLSAMRNHAPPQSQYTLTAAEESRVTTDEDAQRKLKLSSALKELLSPARSHLPDDLTITRQDLADFHAQMLQVNSQLHLFDALFRATVDEATRLENLQLSIQRTARRRDQGFATLVLCFLFVSASSMVLWTELTLPDSALNPLALLIQSLRTYHPLALIIGAGAFVTYVSLCCVLGLFRMKCIPWWAPYLYLAPHQTDVQSLLFNAMNCLRVATPMAYNFIAIMRSGTTDVPTTFEEVMGPMAYLPFLGGDSFGLYAPLAFLLPFAILTLFNLYDLLLKRACGVHDVLDDDDELTAQEGRWEIGKAQRSGASSTPGAVEMI